MLPAALMKSIGNALGMREALILTPSEEARLALAKWGPASVLSEPVQMAGLLLRGGVSFFQSFPFKGCLDTPALT